MIVRLGWWRGLIAVTVAVSVVALVAAPAGALLDRAGRAAGRPGWSTLVFVQTLATTAYNDGLLNPFIAAHGRVDIDLPGYDEGVVGQIGIAPGTTLGPVSLSFPVTVSFDTDGFHAGDGGFAYVSAGIGASVPLAKHVSLSLGATYYHTNDDVIPNVDSDFVVGSAGIVISF